MQTEVAKRAWHVSCFVGSFGNKPASNEPCDSMNTAAVSVVTQSSVEVGAPSWNGCVWLDVVVRLLVVTTSRFVRHGTALSRNVMRHGTELSRNVMRLTRHADFSTVIKDFQSIYQEEAVDDP